MSILKVLPKLYSTKRGESLTREGLRIVQRTRLRKLLRHALAKSRFYSRLYRESGITLANVDEIELEDLPIVNKETLMQNFDDVVCSD